MPADLPIPLTTHSSADSHSDSESDDDETKSKESETESKSHGSRQSSRGQKSIPKSIVTSGKKGTTLPVVHEGEELKETSKPAASSTRRSTRASNKKTDVAETTSVASSRRSTRSSTKKDESVAS